MKPNKLRELLNAKKPTIGTHVSIPWPRLIEVMGRTGTFDYIEYVGEYSTYTLEQFENFGRAFDLFPNMSSMIKVEEQTRGFIAQRALDAGFQNVLFADCRDAKDVRECIRFVRPETPEAGGIHGVGVRRIQLWSNAKEWVEAMNNVVMRKITVTGDYQPLATIVTMPDRYISALAEAQTRMAAAQRGVAELLD